MAIKKIKDKNQLPKWFDIDAYSALSDLSESEIFDQLLIRIEELDFIAKKTLIEEMHCDNDSVNIEFRSDTSAMPCGVIDLLKLGEVILFSGGEVVTFQNQIIKGTIKQPQSMSIKGNSFMESYLMHEMILNRTNGKITLDKNGGISARVKSQVLHSDITMLERAYNPFSLKDKVNCSINLAAFSNSQIISEFTYLLDQWREELNIPEPDKAERNKPDVNKIIEYKLIPLLDLKVWEQETHYTDTPIILPERVIESAIYPDGARDLDRTVKNYLTKVTNYLRAK